MRHLVSKLGEGAGLLWSALLLGLGGLGGGGFLGRVLRTLPRDLRAIGKLVRLFLHAKRAEWANMTVPKLFRQTVARCPDRVMLHFHQEQWSFRRVEEYSNQIAHYFLARGLARGDTVAVLMENRPEFVATWLGLAKMGAVPALINYNLRADSLVHSILVAGSKALVYSSSLSPAVAAILPSLPSLPTYRTGGPGEDRRRGGGGGEEVPGTLDLDKGRQEQPVGPEPQEVRDSINFKDRLMYIYTSGTTGLPKAAVIKHARYILAAGGLTSMIGVREGDVVYCPLPLYHSVGGMISLSGCMAWGITIVIRDKFSASQYWSDCVAYKVTVAQYIGEICRYLVNSPPCPAETKHSVRLMFGNGLRPDIWRSFVERFGVTDITEFYGSTEGNSNILNFDNTVGAVGFVPVLASSLLPLGPVRLGEDGEPERDADTGLCVRCKVGEPGEFVGAIQQNHPVREFAGYSDRAATAGKVLRDVWSKGDMCFRSGDILVSDELGYLYFKDRQGDTFRWKGENVSTTEVEGVVSRATGLGECVVYGVKVSGCEGRAGMAALQGPLADIDRLAEEVVASLPAYARPVFLRLVEQLAITGTYKLKKRELQTEGWDPATVQDPLFLLDSGARRYRPLDSALHRQLLDGTIRL